MRNVHIMVCSWAWRKAFNLSKGKSIPWSGLVNEGQALSLIWSHVISMPWFDIVLTEIYRSHSFLHSHLELDRGCLGTAEAMLTNLLCRSCRCDYCVRTERACLDYAQNGTCLLGWSIWHACLPRNSEHLYVSGFVTFDCSQNLTSSMERSPFNNITNSIYYEGLSRNWHDALRQLGRSPFPRRFENPHSGIWSEMSSAPTIFW